MLDIEKLGKIVSDIERYFKELESFNLNEKTIDDSKIFYASSMAMFGILSRMIDLAEEIILKREIGIPQTYRDYFFSLSKEGIIGQDMAKELAELCDIRNKIAHQYFDIGSKDLLKIKKKVYIVRDFVNRVKKVLDKE
jgi:uncharacterized protein YutE (UPF0331/DUF86 family)